MTSAEPPTTDPGMALGPADELRGALATWRSVLDHLNSGVPIEGLKTMARYNIAGLETLIRKWEGS